MAELKNYPTYGHWHVTTEGDVEGRSTRDLGTHEGHIDDIAFALADQCYYSLRFDFVKPSELLNTKKPARKKVNVSLGIDSGTWDLHGQDLVDYWQECFKGRGVTVLGNQYFAGVEIARDADAEAILEERRQEELERNRRDIARRVNDETLERQRREARSKLTLRERQILGLK